MFRARVTIDDDVVIMNDNSIVLNAMHDVAHLQFEATSIVKINHAFLFCKVNR